MTTPNEYADRIAELKRRHDAARPEPWQPQKVIRSVAFDDMAALASELAEKLQASDTERYAALREMAKARGQAADARSESDIDRMIGWEYAENRCEGDGLFAKVYRRAKAAEQAHAETKRELERERRLREAIAEHSATITDLALCCVSWEPDARIIGNITAGSLRALAEVLVIARAAIHAPAASPGAPILTQARTFFRDYGSRLHLKTDGLSGTETFRAMQSLVALAKGLEASEPIRPSAGESRKEMDEFKQYRRKGITEMRPWHPDDDMTRISVSAADKEAGSPKSGDMIARSPHNHEDTWLVSEGFFKKAEFEVVS